VPIGTSDYCQRVRDIVAPAAIAFATRAFQRAEMSHLMTTDNAFRFPPV
jgi:hypothetical protein